jgi:hypothetical protein
MNLACGKIRGRTILKMWKKSDIGNGHVAKMVILFKA